jgi:glycosyltransferase involved in cell wall biosynthesis
MRVLIVTQYYPPEVGAPQNRLSHLASYLKKAGHSVTVLTALPNYPTGKIYDGYRRRLLVDDQHDGIRVVRTWLYTRRNQGFVGRLGQYLSFASLAVLIGMWKLTRQDVVFVESPPLFSGLAGSLIARLKKGRFVLNISDLWCDSAVEMGMVKNRPLINLVKGIEKKLYQRADAIIGQTQGIVTKIHTQVPHKPVILVTNGATVERFGEIGKELRARTRKEFDFEDRFVVGYAGLHGLMQDLDVVLETARLLRGCEHILFAFYGDGPSKARLIEVAKNTKMENVRFFPPQPHARMPELLACFDAVVIALKQLPILRGALPSKLFEAMAAGVPIVLAGEGEARRLLEEARCGIAVQPEDPLQLAQGIMELYENEPQRILLGQRGKTHIFQHYDRAQLHKKVETLLSQLTSLNKPFPAEMHASKS